MTTIERLVQVFEDVFEEELDVSKVTPEARLVEDLEMKSIGMLYMAMAVEQEFGVKFENEDFEKMRTVSDIIAKIEQA